MLFVLTGPESSAKSTLARHLSEHFAVPCVEEAARAYLHNRAGYGPSDLLQIAQLQLQAEAQARRQQSRELLIADTDLQVLHIWWQEKYGPAPLTLSRAYSSLGPRHYLLCKPDLPWEEDALRENAHDRERLFELYQTDLQARRLPFSEINGHGADRAACAISAVEQILGR